MMERIRRHRSALLLSFFRVLTYGCLTALFFGLMAVGVAALMLSGG